MGGVKCRLLLGRETERGCKNKKSMTIDTRKKEGALVVGLLDPL